MDWELHYRKLERMYAGANSQKPFTAEMRISEGAAEQTLRVEPKLFHAAHAVHGHVYFKMMDDTSFFAASSLVPDVFVLTVSYNVYFVRPISEGEMRASSRVVQRAKSLYIVESKILSSADEEIACGSGAFMKSKTPLSPEIGYR